MTQKMLHIRSLSFWLLLALLTVAAGTPRRFAESASPVGGQENHVFLPVVITTPIPIIHSFHADVDVADPGDTIQLEWSTSYATEVTLYHLLPSGQFGSFWDVPVAGVFTYTIALTERNHTDFMLFAANAGGDYTSASVFITLTCPDSWFFSPAPDICPATAALISPGAEQHFEHGTMLWVGGEDNIYILFDDDQSSHWMVYTDNWSEGDPVSDPDITPPSGFYQPLRGFGLVWREEPGVRDRLGWAVDMEAGYETAVQRTSYSKYNSTYIKALDGDVWRLLPEFSGWEKLVVDP